MTKKNIFKMIDKLFWLGIVAFPLIVHVVMCIHNDMSAVSLVDTMTRLGLSFSFESPIYTGLYEIFAVGGGYLELISSNALIVFATYFITIEILHLIVDFLLFLIRWAQNILHKGVKE